MPKRNACVRCETEQQYFDEKALNISLECNIRDIGVR